MLEETNEENRAKLNDVLGKLQQKSTLRFLQSYPTPELARAASAEQIAGLLKETKHTRAEAAATHIVEVLHQPHLSAGEVTTRTKSRLMLALVAQLLPRLQQMSAYDEEIERLFLSHEDKDVFTSRLGAGKRLAPRLLAEIGDDPTRYEHAASLQALGGTSPVPFQSGNYSKPHRRLGCIKPLRNALHQFAWQSTQQEPWAKAYYEGKRADGKSHSMAVRALSNIWARILFAMCSSHQSYDRAAFENSKRMHAPHAIA